MRTTIVNQLNIEWMQTKQLGDTPEWLATQVTFEQEELSYVLTQDEEMICVADAKWTVRCACLNATCESLSAILNWLRERDSSRTLH